MDLPKNGPENRPAIIVTGASGLVGRHFINSFKKDYYIYGISRSGRKNADIPAHENLRWLRCDIGDGVMVSRMVDSMAAETDIDYIFHFAGYYDFDYRDKIEYRRTNVDGTRHLLEAAARLKVKRFIFSSSLAVSDFMGPHRIMDEETPPDGDYPYARSKKEAEDLVASYAERFPCTIARLAAVYSDWCEYAPLYVLLNTWVGGGFRSKIIAGRGETAIPYIHVHDLNCFWQQIFKKGDRLGNLDILAASPSGCVSHNELFAALSLAYGGSTERAFHLPVPLATAGVALLRLAGPFMSMPPFERPWMTKYIDKRMVVDARRTQQLLDWRPKPRYHVMRRLLFLVENMKSDPRTWEHKNLAMTKQAVKEWPGLKIYNAMVDLRERVVGEHVAYLTAEESRDIFPNYFCRDPADLRLRSELMYQMLESSIRLGDHLSILTYANYLARRRCSEGIEREELMGSLEHIGDLIEHALRNYPGLEELHKTIHFEIGISMQIILDEIDDTYDGLRAGDGSRC